MLIATKSKDELKSVKVQHLNEFVTKSWGATNKIPGMEILRDRVAGKLYLSQKRYFEKVFSRFKIQSAKSVTTLLAVHFRLLFSICTQLDDKVDYISRVSYSSVVSSSMYAIVCSHLDLAYAVNRYLANPRKEHWKAVQWILRY